MHRVPLFKFFNRESNTFDRFQVAWKFATANKFTPWGFSGWRNGVQTVWFNRVKNDCSLWHDTGGGIFWQFLFLATLLFEYKKKSSLNKWISSLEITFLSFFHKRERERKKWHWFFTPKTVWLNFDLVATRKFSRGANIFL